MKLLFCPHCNDVIKLRVGVSRSCECGKSEGMYIDDVNAIVNSSGILLGFANSSFVEALRDHIHRPEGRLGHEFTAFVIPEDAGSVKREGTNTWIPAMREKLEEQKHAAVEHYASLMADQIKW